MTLSFGGDIYDLYDFIFGSRHGLDQLTNF